MLKNIDRLTSNFSTFLPITKLRGGMMTLKHRILWVLFFVLNQFFMSFIINCGEDLPYDLSTLEEEEEEASGSANVNCDCSGFLIASCVGECEEETTPDTDVDAEDEDEIDAGDDQGSEEGDETEEIDDTEEDAGDAAT